MLNSITTLSHNAVGYVTQLINAAVRLFEIDSCFVTLDVYTMTVHVCSKIFSSFIVILNDAVYYQRIIMIIIIIVEYSQRLLVPVYMFMGR